MTPRHFLARPVRKSILAATAAVLVALAAACSSPTSPVASNASASMLHNANTPATHDACGVGVGSSQC
jgi:hypothetical protein